MHASHAGSFSRLCRVLGGVHPAALDDCVAARQLQPLFELARRLDLLPALAVRCHERNAGPDVLGVETADALRQALLDNTRRNLMISAQAVSLAKLLNRAGITPLFLKGTARLLTAGAGSLGFRKQVDIDLIVPPDDIAVAADVLLDDGYTFAADAGTAPTRLRDAASAIRASAAHHHLPPLEKDGYIASVELHRHFLDKRFQRRNPVQTVFETAQACRSHGAAFQIASAEHRIIQLVLGKFVNDGFLARRTFPVREGCDLIEILRSAGGDVDQAFLLRRCGPAYALFQALTCELMQFPAPTGSAARADTSNFTRMMYKRCESPAFGALLDAYARTEYLVHALVNNPGKLPAFLRNSLSAHRA